MRSRSIINKLCLSTCLVPFPLMNDGLRTVVSSQVNTEITISNLRVATLGYLLLLEVRNIPDYVNKESIIVIRS